MAPGNLEGLDQERRHNRELGLMYEDILKWKRTSNNWRWAALCGLGYILADIII